MRETCPRCGGDVERGWCEACVAPTWMGPRLEQCCWVVIVVAVSYAFGEAAYSLFGLARAVTGL